MTPLDDEIATALRSFLVTILPSGVGVFQGQANRVPEPEGDDFVIFTVMSDTRLSTNVDAYNPTGNTATRTDPTQAAYQLDIHGPNSTDNARAIKALWRSSYACDVFGDVMSPLYASDGAQRPFINGEGQYEDRWVMTLEAQINVAVVTPQDFADKVDISYFPVGV